MTQYGLLLEHQGKVRQGEQFSSYALVGLRNYYNNFPDKFISRVSKGPPPAYRWLAWRFLASQCMKKTKGNYEFFVQEGESSQWLHDIDKDLGRTYPTHPLFDVNKGQGVIGQKALRNVLQAYAAFNPEVGYC